MTLDSIDQIPKTPELLLKSYNHKLRNLLSSSVILGNIEIERKLKNCYKKSAIAELTYNRYVIAISGLQGVGKSTLFKQLYNIPDELIPENIGRGEKLPIFITEENVTSIVPYVKRARRTNEGYELNLNKLTTEEFIQIAKNPKEDDLWLEIIVPYRYFYTNDKSIVLLPGIEDKKTDEDNYWQNLVLYILTMSASSVMVFNSTVFADEDNQKLIETIKREYGDSKPLFALSFSDLAFDGNEELKGRMIEKFRIPTHESDRVIPTGTGVFLETDWLTTLMNAVHKYSTIERTFRRQQVKKLEDMALELNVVLETIREEIEGRQLMEYSENDNNYRAPLRLFDTTCQKLKRLLEKDWNNQLKTHIGESITHIQNVIDDKKKLQKLKELTIGKSYHEHLNFMREIQKSWDTPEGYEPLNNKLIRKVEGFIQKQLGNQMLLEPESKLNSKMLMLPNEHFSNDQKQLSIRKDVLSNLEKYYSNSKDTSELVVLEKDSLKLIPLIALERVREALLLANYLTLDEQQKVIKPSGVDFKDQLKSIAASPGSIVNGAAILFGLDAVDGTINTVPALLNALGIKVGVAATSIAVSLVGLVSLSYVTISVIRQITKQSITDEDLAVRIINDIKDNYLQMLLDHVDNTFQEVRDKLEIRLRKNLHMDETFVRWQRLRLAMAQVDNKQFQLREMINNNAGFLV
jgi:hypothetical protein